MSVFLDILRCLLCFHDPRDDNHYEEIPRQNLASESPVQKGSRGISNSSSSCSHQYKEYPPEAFLITPRYYEDYPNYFISSSTAEKVPAVVMTESAPALIVETSVEMDNGRSISDVTEEGSLPEKGKKKRKTKKKKKCSEESREETAQELHNAENSTPSLSFCDPLQSDSGPSQGSTQGPSSQECVEKIVQECRNAEDPSPLTVLNPSQSSPKQFQTSCCLDHSSCTPSLSSSKPFQSVIETPPSLPEVITRESAPAPTVGTSVEMDDGRSILNAEEGPLPKKGKKMWKKKKKCFQEYVQETAQELHNAKGYPPSLCSSDPPKSVSEPPPSSPDLEISNPLPAQECQFVKKSVQDCQNAGDPSPSTVSNPSQSSPKQFQPFCCLDQSSSSPSLSSSKPPQSVMETPPSSSDMILSNSSPASAPAKGPSSSAATTKLTWRLVTSSSSKSSSNPHASVSSSVPSQSSTKASISSPNLLSSTPKPIISTSVQSPSVAKGPLSPLNTPAAFPLTSEPPLASTPPSELPKSSEKHQQTSSCLSEPPQASTPPSELPKSSEKHLQTSSCLSPSLSPSKLPTPSEPSLSTSFQIPSTAAESKSDPPLSLSRAKSSNSSMKPLTPSPKPLKWKPKFKKYNTKPSAAKGPVSPSNPTASSFLTSDPALHRVPFLLTTQPERTDNKVVDNISLPSHLIPQDVADLIEKDNLPFVLKKPLSHLTFERYFSVLLYAEEDYLEKWSGYQLKDVTLELRNAATLREPNKLAFYQDNEEKENKTFVSFMIDSVPERRLFLLPGDLVLAKPSGRGVNPFKGLICRAEKSNRVVVDFQEDFFSQHLQDCKYDISFKLNGVGLKRALQAIEVVAEKSFRNFLFPHHISADRIISKPALLCDIFTFDENQRVTILEISSVYGTPPLLIEGQYCVNEHKTRFNIEELSLSRMGETVLAAVFEIYLGSPLSNILLCAPTDKTCIALMRYLKKLIPESEMFHSSAAFQEEGDEPDDNSTSTPPLEQLLKCRVIFSTFISSFHLHNQGLAAGHFSHIFLLDASLVIEPEVLIPVAYLAKEDTTVVLTGQLGDRPLRVRSSLARTFGLGTSYFERLSKSWPYTRYSKLFIRLPEEKDD